MALAAVGRGRGGRAGRRARSTGWRHRPPLDPLSLALELADGRTRWPPAATLIAIAAGAVVLALAGRDRGRARSRRRPARQADRAARLLATGRDIHPVSLRNAQRDREAVRRRAGRAAGRSRGRRRPGRCTRPGRTCSATSGGPGSGKTTARAIPTLLAAPGAAFATSNKPDLYAATRGVRERSGRVWNFDPEQIAGGQPGWWWNPLSYVTSDRRALELTDAFVGAYRDPDARPDPFFDPAGQELVAHLLRAAALDQRPITQAFLWSHAPQRRRARPHPRRARARARRRVGARPRPLAV